MVHILIYRLMSGKLTTMSAAIATNAVPPTIDQIFLLVDLLFCCRASFSLRIFPPISLWISSHSRQLSARSAQSFARRPNGRT